MQSFNLHTHTYRCHHASGYDEQYIQAAIDANMKVIGFSEHMPYPNVEVESERMFNKDIEEYLQTMYLLKEKYKDKITILVGFEIEYYDDQKDYLLSMKDKCDYFIIGRHYKYYDGYNYDFYCSDEDVLTYARQIEKALDLGLTKYIAHPDFFVLGRRSFNNKCKEAAHIICQAALRNNAILEINLNGLRYGQLYYNDEKKYAYPYRDFFKIVSYYRCKVCYGYDAHKPVTLLEKTRIDECQKILHNIPLIYVENIEEFLS